MKLLEIGEFTVNEIRVYSRCERLPFEVVLHLQSDPFTKIYTYETILHECE